MRVLLKKRRKELALTQKDLAEKLFVARNTYTNIELGNKNPSLLLALNIKRVLEYNKDDIFLNEYVPK